MLYTYSVIPLVEDHFEERVADLIAQNKRNISTCPLFSVVIQPQGDPVWHRGPEIARVYARYKARLDAAGVPSGILLQSTLGHGTAAYAKAPYQLMESLRGFGKEEMVTIAKLLKQTATDFENSADSIRRTVAELCAKYPLY